jgi:hypothetical protein
MGDAPTFQSNPYASFDPSQWKNPYSRFFGKALPWPSSYAGTPTNALGQPIAAPPQGMTLNSTPAQPQQPAASSPDMSRGVYSMYGGASPGLPMGQGVPLSQFAGGNYGSQNMNDAAGLASLMGLDPSRLNGFQGQQQQQAAPAAAAPNNWQQTLSMLANPGHVTTPGATVPQAASSAQPGPGVLQSFLANWQPAQSGAGSGFTQNFNTILRGLQAQKGS